MTLEGGSTYIVCDKCGGPTRVLDSRGSGEQCVRRRRKCVNCKHRFSTYEIISDSKPGADVAVDVVGDLSERLLAALTLARRAHEALRLARDIGRKESAR